MDNDRRWTTFVQGAHWPPGLGNQACLARSGCTFSFRIDARGGLTVQNSKDLPLGRGASRDPGMSNNNLGFCQHLSLDSLSRTRGTKKNNKHTHSHHSDQFSEESSPRNREINRFRSVNPSVSPKLAAPVPIPSPGSNFLLSRTTVRWELSSSILGSAQLGKLRRNQYTNHQLLTEKP